MRKLTVAGIIALFVMLIPVLNTVLEHGTDDYEPYSEVVLSFQDFISTKELATNDITATWSSVPSEHPFNTSMITSIDVKNQGTWYNDIENYGYPFSYNYDEITGNISLGHASGTELSILGDGTTTQFYWELEHDETRIHYTSYEDDIEFYAKVFYNDWTISYDDINFMDERTMGFEYDGDDDTAGYSTVELGRLAITDGLFGMLPRRNAENNGWEFPLADHFISSLSIVGGFLWSSISSWWDSKTDQIIYEDDYYEMGNWSEPNNMGHSYYIVEDAGFWGGERLKATIVEIDESNTMVTYQLQSKRFWLWNDIHILDEDDMEDYRIDTSNFTD